MLNKKFWRENGLFIGIIIGLIVAFWLLRTRGDRFAASSAFDAAISAGRPTVVEFFSNT